MVRLYSGFVGLSRKELWLTENSNGSRNVKQFRLLNPLPQRLIVGVLHLSVDMLQRPFFQLLHHQAFDGRELY